MGVPHGDVLADCGYSNRSPENFARPIRRAARTSPSTCTQRTAARREPTKEPLSRTGTCFVRALPTPLLELGRSKEAPASETAIHDARSAELARYKLGRVSRDSEDGSHRVMCPALLGKVRCPLRAESMSLDFKRPEVTEPPAYPPTCCVQKTITIKEEVTAKTAEHHDYPSKGPPTVLFAPHRQQSAHSPGCRTLRQWG